MKITFSKRAELSDLWVLPFWQGPKKAHAAAVDLKYALKDFEGKKSELLLTYVEGQRALLLGLGKKEEITPESFREAYAAMSKWAQEKKITKVDLFFPECKEKKKVFQAILEGALLNSYSFDYKTKESKKEEKKKLEELHFIGIEEKKLAEETLKIIEGVYFVRDLVNANADGKIDEVIQKAKSLSSKVKVHIFDKKWIKAQKMGLLLAVNRASEEGPFFLELIYQGDPKKKEEVVLVGKGVTYDTGGLSLKPTDGMVSMKCDMAGAATVLGAIKTAADLKLKVNVTALLPLTENGIDGTSYKPGDVYTSFSKKTVEITNTDAEGRLILADALGYAVEKRHPSCVIDLATLTGACLIALGEKIAGLFSNDDKLSHHLLKASEETDERIWRLPIPKDYEKMLESDIADMINSAGRYAGSITAALFLKAFVKDVPWAHLDIAGPSFLSKKESYHPTKATGYGLRLLVQFLKDRQAR